MKTGADRLFSDPPNRLQGARLGLVTNDGARLLTTPELLPRQAFLNAGLRVVQLFSPEHGLAASAADGAAVDDATDPVTGLSVRSLYGASVKPDPEELRKLDIILFDLPDTGYRFYTYIWTLFLLMEACEEAERPLFVLDRPNPIGGEMDSVEGPILDTTRFSSFLGMYAMPIRHSLTVGELANLWQKEKFPRLDLTIISLDGWKRSDHWPESHAAFTPPSPAIRSYPTVLTYGGLCLLEGTNVSVGRGTDRPFLQFGAPWLRSQHVAEVLESHFPETLTAEPTRFTPQSDPNRGISCEGVSLYPRTPRCIRPVEMGFQILATLLSLHPDAFAWSPYQTVANPGGRGHFDRLVGRDDIRPTLEAKPASIDATAIQRWTAAPNWQAEVTPHLLYE